MYNLTDKTLKNIQSMIHYELCYVLPKDILDAVHDTLVQLLCSIGYAIP